MRWPRLTGAKIRPRGLPLAEAPIIIIAAIDAEAFSRDYVAPILRLKYI